MRLSPAWLVTVPVLAAAIVWWPLTGGYFHADDFLHLYVIGDGRAVEFLLTPHAGHMLTVWNGLVLAAHALFGAETRAYHLLALVLHLLNIGLLFTLLRRAAGAALACFGATLWGTAPYVGDSVGWLSVTGHVVLTTFVLLTLDGLLTAAGAGRPVSGRRAFAWGILLLGGAASFGIGIGVALAAAVAVPLLLPGDRTARRLAMALPVAVIAAYTLTQIAYAEYAHGARSSVVPELSLTALWTVLSLFVELLSVGIAAAAAGILAPIAPDGATALVACWAALVGAGLWQARPAQRRAIAAMLLLAGGSYGIVALGRGPQLANLALSASSAAESARYHYLPGALLIAALCLALSAIAERWQPPRALTRAALVAWLLAVALMVALRPPAIDRYDAERDDVEAMTALLRQRAAETPGGEPIYLFNRRLYPLGYIVRPEEFPGWAGAFIATESSDVFEGHPVRFIENDGALLNAVRARPGTRTAKLLVSRAEYRQAMGLPAPAPATRAKRREEAAD